MKYLLVSGSPMKEIEADGITTAANLLKQAGISRSSGEVLILGSKSIPDDHVVNDGETLVYVPPVSRGLD
jgi:sulfur carrier protein ThiS